MTHRDDLHYFDAAAASVREKLQAATHTINVQHDGDTVTIICAPCLEVLIETSTADAPQESEENS